MKPTEHREISTTNTEIENVSNPLGSASPFESPRSRFGNFLRLRRLPYLISSELGGETLHPRIIVLHAIMSLFPFQAGSRIRTALYRLAGFRIGTRTLICDKLNLWGDSHIYTNLRLGADCFISWGCNLDLNGTITLEDRVVIGFGVTIVTASHVMDDSYRRAGKLDVRPVVIAEGAWIGANVLILPGITIGAGAVVGAGSVVTKDVPSNTLVAGNPARIIRTLPTSNSEE